MELPLLGAPRVHLRKTDSTNERAKALALRGAPHGTLVTAEEQTQGRGRRGRRWLAPARQALLMSLLLRWTDGQEPPSLLPLRAAVAVCDVAGPQASVKWPNDVLIGGEGGAPAKVAGILIEGRPGDAWAVLGIGLNVAVQLRELPKEVRSIAATLGRTPDAIEQALRELLLALRLRLSQPREEILAAWRSRDALFGSEVQWSGGSGRAEGIDEDGQLLVRAHDGALVAIDSGEVTVR